MDGDQTTYTADAIPIIRWLAGLLHTFKLNPEDSEYEFLPYATEQEVDSSTEEWTVTILGKPSWTVLTAMVETTYFTRLWSIQEIVLSSKAAFICGEHRIAWKTFYEAALCIRILDIGDLLVDPRIFFIGELCSRSFDPEIAFILQLFSDSKVTDPRYHVYGHLGMLEKWSLKHSMHVDYSSTVEEVFVKSTADTIMQTQGLSLLKKQ
jgi:hypothetical protein